MWWIGSKYWALSSNETTRHFSEIPKKRPPHPRPRSALNGLEKNTNMCELCSAARKQNVIQFVLQAWNEIRAGRAWTSCVGFCPPTLQILPGLSVWCRCTYRKLCFGLAKLQEGWFKQSSSKITKKAFALFLSQAAHWRREGQFYGEMDWKSVKEKKRGGSSGSRQTQEKPSSSNWNQYLVMLRCQTRRVQ